MNCSNIFISCFLSCMPCFAEQATAVPVKTHEFTTDQKVYRAAFDLGSSLFKMAVAEIDPNTNEVKRIVGEKLIDVSMGDDVKKYGTISPECEVRALTALSELVTLARELSNSDVKMKGIATAIFRKAGTRGAEVLAHLNEVVGSQNFIKVIPAAIEGQVGLRTAKIVALEKNPARASPTVAWDSGNSSFQVSYDTDQGIGVFEGNIGAADAKSIYINDILGLPGYEIDQIKYQPLSQEQMDLLVALLKEKFGAAEEKLQNALGNEKNHVVTIGDSGSIFSIVGVLLGKNTFTKAEVKELLNRLVNSSDIEDLRAKYPSNIAYIAPHTAFLYAVMDKLNIDSIENYFSIGGTKGLLVTPELWQE